MLLTIIIKFLLTTVIPGLLYQVYVALCPSLNAGIPITTFLVWKKARFQILGVLLAVIVAIPLCLYVYLGVSGTLMIQVMLFLGQASLFLLGKLADYFQKKKNDNSNNNKLSA